MRKSGLVRGAVKTDPQLTRQLDEAHGTHQSVAAVLMLRPSGKDIAVPPGKVRDVANSAITRVEKEVGTSATTVNVLDNLGMIIVAGEEPFVRRLLEQPEFASAVANSTVD